MFLVKKAMGCVCGKQRVTVEEQDYIVRSKLGEGGFSMVSLIEHSRNHKLYALKQILCHSKEDKRTAEREIEYMRKLANCPGIINITANESVPVNISSSSVICRVYIVMPYYQSGSLQDLIEGSNFPEPDILIRLLMKVCETLRWLHNSTPALAHRDIKPANVLLEDDLNPILMDLGSMSEAEVSVKDNREAQQVQDVAAERCSMPYRAPELFAVQTGDKISSATDIWCALCSYSLQSLGCLIYACIYGEAPFDSVYQKGGSIALAAVGGNVDYPEQDRYSHELVEIAKICLNPNPIYRANIDTVIEKLDSLSERLQVRV